MLTFRQEILEADLENLRQLGCCFLRGPLFWVSYRPPHRVTHHPIRTGPTVMSLNTEGICSSETCADAM